MQWPSAWILLQLAICNSCDAKQGAHQLKVKTMLVNPFPNKPWVLCVCSTSLLKTLWLMEKLLVTSNFSFSNSVFYPFVELSAVFIQFEIVVCKLFQFERVQNLSFGKGLKGNKTAILDVKLHSKHVLVDIRHNKINLILCFKQKMLTIPNDQV